MYALHFSGSKIGLAGCGGRPEVERKREKERERERGGKGREFEGREREERGRGREYNVSVSIHQNVCVICCNMSERMHENVHECVCART
jgi:hypothetical protein